MSRAMLRALEKRTHLILGGRSAGERGTGLQPMPRRSAKLQLRAEGELLWARSWSFELRRPAEDDLFFEAIQSAGQSSRRAEFIARLTGLAFRNTSIRSATKDEPAHPCKN